MANEEVFVEKSPRPSVLVVEDNTLFAEMAKHGLKEYSVCIAHTLWEAIDLAGSKKLDFILSDVMFPAKKGYYDTDNSMAMLQMALNKAAPIAFVTRGDHHGMITRLIDSEKPQITIKCLSLGDIHHSLVNLSHNQNQKKPDFNCITASHSKVMNAENKDQVIWSYALINLKNISAKETPISASMKKVKRTLGEGAGFEMKSGSIRLTDPRIRR
jgi:CheY-like chemotaxis protein